MVVDRGPQNRCNNIDILGLYKIHRSAGKTGLKNIQMEMNLDKSRCTCSIKQHLLL